MNIENVLIACKEVKKRLKDTKICLGGFYATYNDRRLFKEYDVIDIIVRGEGECTVLELVQHLEK